MVFGIGEAIAVATLGKSITDMRDLIERLKQAGERYKNAGDLYQQLADEAEACRDHAHSLEMELKSYDPDPSKVKNINKIIKRVKRLVDEVVNSYLEKVAQSNPWSFRNKCKAAMGRKLREVSSALDQIQNEIKTVDQRCNIAFRETMSEQMCDVQENVYQIDRNVHYLVDQAKSGPPPPPYEESGRKDSAIFRIPSPSTAPEIHDGIVCDACFECPIKGTRWRCETCPDHDLCDDCKRKGHEGRNCRLRIVSAQETAIRHQVRQEQVANALQEVIEELEPQEHQGINCDSCEEKPIKGPRWHCDTCPAHDLCDFCHRMRRGGPFCQWRVMSVAETDAEREAAAGTLAVGLLARLMLS